MYIELLDVLRCTSDHPQIPLVTAIGRRDGRFVLDATMGCPACRREFPIIGGTVFFADAATERSPAAPVGGGDDAMSIAAYLAVSEGATYVLMDEWAQYAPQVAAMTAVRIFAVNPSSPPEESEQIGVVHTDTRLPFAAGALRGLAAGMRGWTSGDVTRAIGTVAPGGRIVAPASVEVPAGITEIGRDESVWVGEKRGPLVALHRR